MKHFAIALLAFVAVLGGANAALINSPLTTTNHLTAEQLYQICTGDEDGQGLCATYVMGVIEGMVIAEDKELCLPKKPLVYDNIGAAITEALRHTKIDRRSATAVGAVAGIMTRLYPCKH
jgi:hypothetical protein